VPPAAFSQTDHHTHKHAHARIRTHTYTPPHPHPHTQHTHTHSFNNTQIHTDYNSALRAVRDLDEEIDGLRLPLAAQARALERSVARLEAAADRRRRGVLETPATAVAAFSNAARELQVAFEAGQAAVQQCGAVSSVAGGEGRVRLRAVQWFKSLRVVEKPQRVGGRCTSSPSKRQQASTSSPVRPAAESSGRPQQQSLERGDEVGQKQRLQQRRRRAVQAVTPAPALEAKQFSPQLLHPRRLPGTHNSPQQHTLKAKSGACVGADDGSDSDGSAGSWLLGSSSVQHAYEAGRRDRSHPHGGSPVGAAKSTQRVFKSDRADEAAQLLAEAYQQLAAVRQQQHSPPSAGGSALESAHTTTCTARASSPARRDSEHHHPHCD